jgi:transcriptional regulator with XRE-family HTH domain
MIARLRKQQHVTLLQLAKRVGVTEAYMSMLERGVRKNPSLPTLKKLAKALKVSVAELVQYL